MAPTSLVSGTAVVPHRERRDHEVHDPDLRLPAGLRRHGREADRPAGLVGGGLRGHGRVHGVVQQGPGRLGRARRDPRAGRSGPHPAAPAPERRPGGDRRAVRRDPGGPRRLLDRGVRELRPGDRDRRPARQLPGARPRWPPPPWPTCGRSPIQRPTWSSDRSVPGTEAEDLLRRLAPQVLGAVVAALRPLRHRRGRRPGGAAGGGHAVADRRRPGQPAGLADHGRLAPADRPAAQRAGPPAPRGRASPAGRCRSSGWRPPPTGRRPSPTTRSSCCSCAAIPPCRRRRRSR